MMVTSFYASLLALMFIGLSVRVILLRIRHKVGIGDGGVEILRRAARVQGNFAEYVPFALLLMLMIELNDGPDGVVHGMGLALLVGRIFHAYGVSPVQEHLLFRQMGMMLTFTVLTGGAVALILLAMMQ